MPKFVILEHQWNGVHWDLMLEDGSMLRTWSIEPPIIPGREQPARALAHHRLVYLDYEGPISGGRGSVRRVDRGAYSVKLWGPSRVVVELDGAQLVGELDLVRGDPGRSADLETGWTLRFLGKVA